MDIADVTNQLDGMTGSWTPGEGASDSDLEDAQRALASALANGLTPQALGAGPDFLMPVPSGSRPAIEAIIQSLGTDPTLDVLPHVRSADDFDPAALAATSGMAVSRTLGPFVDAAGAAQWVDLIPIPRKIPISSDTRGVLAYLIASSLSATLGPGSIWVVAAAFSGAPAVSGLVGLSFSACTATRTGAVTVNNTGVVIGAGGTLTLALTLEPPAVPPGPPGVGPDAHQMALALPQNVTLAFTEGGAAFTAIGAASATVYGTSLTLKRNTTPPAVFTLGFDYLLFPCDSSITQFAFQKVLSQEVIPSGQAPILGGGWALFILPATPPQQLGAASSAGSLALELGSGASLKFAGLTSPAGAGQPQACALTRDDLDFSSEWSSRYPRPLDVVDARTAANRGHASACPACL